jgi:uncharacterized membrane-anchored protein YhcB (DUF1043 family)
MEIKQSYGERLRAAAWKEFKAFWSAYRVCGTFATFLSPFAVQVHNHGVKSMLNMADVAESGLLGLAVSLAGNYVIAMRKGAEVLDAGIRKESEAHQQTITTLRANLDEFKKPRRTTAEEHHYATAKAALETLGEDSAVVLRHLSQHGSLLFGSMDPPVPKGMNARDTRALLNVCLNEGLVTLKTTDKPGGFDYTYAIAPGMKPALDELLYQ